MTRRYYAPEIPSRGGLIQLGDDEARHVSRVMRATVGDSVVLFDGIGNESEAIIHAIDKRHCTVNAAEPVNVDREPDRKIHLGIAFPKPERAKDMIERLTELGVKRITPLVCDRTQRPPTESLLSKLRRIVIESCKQSQRNVLMQIDPAADFQAFVAEQTTGIGLIAHPDGDPIGQRTRESTESKTAKILVGPEGGFTDDEIEQAVEAGYRKVNLGQRIYRIETAATVIAAKLVD